MKLKKKTYSTDIRWIMGTPETRDVFGNPVEWAEGTTRVVYRSRDGARVYLRQRLTLSLSDDMRLAVERAARATGRPLSEVGRQCLISKLAREVGQ